MSQRGQEWHERIGTKRGTADVKLFFFSEEVFTPETTWSQEGLWNRAWTGLGTSSHWLYEEHAELGKVEDAIRSKSSALGILMSKTIYPVILLSLKLSTRIV